jgi:hypothetical protein
MEGKAEIGECKCELVTATTLLSTLLQSEGLSVLWKVEPMLEALQNQYAALELHKPPKTTTGRPRASSKTVGTLFAVVVAARMKMNWLKSQPQRAASQGKPQKPIKGRPWQPKLVARVGSDLMVTRKRALEPKDTRVKLILKYKNNKERGKETARKWTLAAARVVERDPGRTGLVTAEKAIVLLVGRVEKKY